MYTDGSTESALLMRVFVRGRGDSTSSTVLSAVRSCGAGILQLGADFADRALMLAPPERSSPDAKLFSPLSSLFRLSRQSCPTMLLLISFLLPPPTATSSSSSPAVLGLTGSTVFSSTGKSAHDPNDAGEPPNQLGPARGPLADPATSMPRAGTCYRYIRFEHSACPLLVHGCIMSATPSAPGMPPLSSSSGQSLSRRGTPRSHSRPRPLHRPNRPSTRCDRAAAGCCGRLQICGGAATQTARRSAAALPIQLALRSLDGPVT